ncbi:MAG: hypothetical protein E5W87_34615, partial [Mesorhizobium sp.]
RPALCEAGRTSERKADSRLETARHGDVHRAATLARPRQQMIRTDASAQKVEQALASLAEANAPMDRLARHQ